MDRREALKTTTFLVGAMVSSSVATAILNGCTPKPGITWTPTFFTEDQAILITQIADIIIPKTDTPGAKEVGIPAFIEEIVRDVYSEEEKSRFMKGLEAFVMDSATKLGDSFIESNEEDRVSYVVEFHADSVTRYKSEEGSDLPFILMVKQLTMLGFFTSQAGAEQVLQYRAVPGAYHGCMSLEEAGGKTWAT